MLSMLDDSTGESLVKAVVFTEFRYHAMKDIETDDLIGEGFLGLTKAVKQYDKNCGASFPTFAWRNIRNTIIDYLKRENTRNAAKTLLFEDAIDFRYEDNSIATNEINQIISESMRWLTKRQKAVVNELYFNGLPERQAAKTLKIGRTTLGRTKKRALAKLKKVLKRDIRV